ncbi:hypothetical protein [Xanthomonas theicola]|uniref:hypothetical protein n=1 Tax=Xanthomonas theicola TaxID=56464 RepID=UPI001304ABD5|nr:hypothetical protein [Xanthomonas theicola]
MADSSPSIWMAAHAPWDLHFQRRANLLDANVAYRQPVELGRRLFPDARLFGSVEAECENKFHVRKVSMHHHGERAFTDALAFLQHRQIALFDPLPNATEIQTPITRLNLDRSAKGREC